MNAAELMQTCPDPETLSDFVDRQLDSKSRMAVVTHLAQCGDCREVVVNANAYAQMVEAERGVVVSGRFGKRGWLAGLTAAAAAILVATFTVPTYFQTQRINKLVVAANRLPERTTEGRLSAEFGYKEHHNWRGAKNAGDMFIESLAADANDRATKNPNAANLHLAGLGQILRDKQHFSDAIADLERAAREKPSSDEILIDLSAAYLASDGQDNAQRALKSADAALRIKKTPAALWNRALALQQLKRKQDAIQAWNAYLKVDSQSEWAKEARDEQLPMLASGR